MPQGEAMHWRKAEMLACYIFHTFATHSSLACYNTTEKDCWAHSGSTHGHIFMTFRRTFLTGCEIELKTTCMYFTPFLFRSSSSYQFRAYMLFSLLPAKSYFGVCRLGHTWGKHKTANHYQKYDSPLNIWHIMFKEDLKQMKLNEPGKLWTILSTKDLINFCTDLQYPTPEVLFK